MKDTKEITPKEYANWYGCKPQYIHWLLKKEKLDLLPNIIRVKKYSRFYVLEVSSTLSKDSSREIISKKIKYLEV